MAEKPDFENAYEQAIKDLEAHTGQKVDPATAAAIRSGMKESFQTPVELNEEISLRHDAALITTSMARGGISFTSGLLGLPGNITHWVRDKMGYEVGENPFLGSTYINEHLQSGFDGAVRLTGNELPAATTERQKRLAETFETATEYTAGAFSLRGGLQALNYAGKRFLPSVFGEAAGATSAAKMAAAATTKVDDAMKAAAPAPAAPANAAAATAAKTDSTINTAANNADDWNAFMGGADDAARGGAKTANNAGAGAKGAEAAEEATSAGGSAKTGSSWRDRIKYKNNLWVYLSDEKKIGLAQKLESLSERGGDKYIRLLVDERRVSGITAEELAAIKSAHHIKPEIVKDFESIFEKNTFKAPYRFFDRQVERLNFLGNHPVLGSAIAAKEGASLAIKPITYSIQHPIKAVGIGSLAFGADHYISDNNITGAIVRGYVGTGAALGTVGYKIGEWGVTKMMEPSADKPDTLNASGEPGTSSPSSLPSADASLAMASGVAGVVGNAADHIAQGTTNVVVSAADQAGIKIDRDKAHENVAWTLDKIGYGPFRYAKQGAEAFIGAVHDDSDAPFPQLFAQHWAENQVKEATHDIKGAATLAQNAGANAGAGVPDVPAPIVTAQNDIQNGLRATMNQASGLIPGQLPDGLAPLSGVAASIGAAASSQIEETTNQLADAGTQVVEQINAGGKQALASVKNDGKDLLNTTQTKFNEAVEQGTQVATQAVEQGTQAASQALKDGKQQIKITGERAMASMFPDLSGIFGGASDFFSSMFKPITNMFSGGMPDIEGSTMLKIGLAILGGLALNGLAGENKGLGMVMGLMGVLAMSAMLFSDDAEAKETKDRDRRNNPAPAPAPAGP